MCWRSHSVAASSPAPFVANAKGILWKDQNVVRIEHFSKSINWFLVSMLQEKECLILSGSLFVVSSHLVFFVIFVPACWACSFVNPIVIRPFTTFSSNEDNFNSIICFYFLSFFRFDCDMKRKEKQIEWMHTKTKVNRFLELFRKEFFIFLFTLGTEWTQVNNIINFNQCIFMNNELVQSNSTIFKRLFLVQFVKKRSLPDFFGTHPSR